MKAKKIVMGLTIAVFFLMILFPIWGWIFPQPVFESLEEKRALTELDQTGTVKERIENAEAYLDDHLAFRNAAISSSMQIDLALGESPSDMVLAGSDGWLFYVEGEEDFRRGSGLTDEQIKEFYDVHQQLTDYFASLGIDYRVMIAPDKHSIYPQYLPLTRRLGNGPWELKQVLDPPGEGYTVKIIDVSDALLKAAATGVTQYYKTDSHWNWEGGWTAYQAIMDNLLPDHPNMRRLTEDDIVRSPIEPSGDLAALIGQQGIICDNTSILMPKVAFSHTSDGNATIVESCRNAELPDGPKLLLIGDSFRTAMLPFLAVSVSELDVIMNDSPSLASIQDLSHYDIIIYEAVERNRFWLWGGLTGLDGEEEESYEEEYEGD
jgi:hypothetical protein